MRRRSSDSGEHSLNFWPSFTDIIVSILLLFILQTVIQLLTSQQNLSTILIKATQNKVEKLFKQDFGSEDEDVRFLVTGNLQRITFADRLLFTSGEVELSGAGKGLMSEIGRILKKIFDSQGWQSIQKIQVEGYTDRKPIRGKGLTKFGIFDNRDLSAKRSINVVKELEGIGFDPKYLSAVGYGEHQSIYKESDPDELRARDRRIEIVIVYSDQIAAGAKAREVQEGVREGVESTRVLGEGESATIEGNGGR